MEETKVDQEQLGRNIKKLLRSTPLDLSMPAAARERIQAALIKKAQAIGTTRSQSISRRKPVWSYFKVLVPAAAALLVLAAVLFWPTRAPHSVVWADVARNLAKVQSMKCVTFSTTISKEGVKQRGAGRFYIRYPACWRLDFYPYPLPDDFDPAKIDQYDNLIWKVCTCWTTIDHFISTLVRIKEKEGNRFIGHYMDSGITWPIQNLADEVFLDFRQVITGPARKIGTKEIQGIRTEGYEFSASDIPWKSEWIGVTNGIGRLWVSIQNALPVEAEFEFESEGERVFQRYQNMVWNEPIPDDVFLATSFHDCKFSEEHRSIARRMFEKTHFKPGLQFLITTSDGQSVVTSEDVMEVEYGIAYSQSGLDRPEDMYLNIHLKKEACQRLNLTKKHIVLFDGVKLFEGKVRVNPGQSINLLITPLNLTLEQFEEKYLTKAETNEEPHRMM